VRLTPRRLVLVGTVIVDILLYLDRLPGAGEAALATQSVVAAGAGYNVLAGAVRLGLPSAYAGLVGSGPFGTVVREALERIDVPVLLPARVEDTGFDVGLVETSSSRQPTFLGAPGVEATLELADLRSIPLQSFDAVYLSGYDLWYQGQGHAVASWIPELGPDQLFVFDPGPIGAEIIPERLEAALARTDILSLNTAEAAALVGEGSRPELARTLARRIRPDGCVVVRADAEGCWLAGHAQRPAHVPGRPTRPVDTTGAGDAHVAALLARLAAGDNLAGAARWANAAASLAIEQLGPSTCPSAEELAAAMASHSF
jgi:sugar/nucleoside kinase (ribokinase family)